MSNIEIVRVILFWIFLIFISLFLTVSAIKFIYALIAGCKKIKNANICNVVRCAANNSYKILKCIAQLICMLLVFALLLLLLYPSDYSEFFCKFCTKIENIDESPKPEYDCPECINEFSIINVIKQTLNQFSCLNPEGGRTRSPYVSPIEREFYFSPQVLPARLESWNEIRLHLTNGFLRKFGSSAAVYKELEKRLCIKNMRKFRNANGNILKEGWYRFSPGDIDLDFGTKFICLSRFVGVASIPNTLAEIYGLADANGYNSVKSYNNVFIAKEDEKGLYLEFPPYEPDERGYYDVIEPSDHVKIFLNFGNHISAGDKCNEYIPGYDIISIKNEARNRSYITNKEMREAESYFSPKIYHGELEYLDEIKLSVSGNLIFHSSVAANFETDIFKEIEKRLNIRDKRRFRYENKDNIYDNWVLIKPEYVDLDFGDKFIVISRNVGIPTSADSLAQNYGTTGGSILVKDKENDRGGAFTFPVVLNADSRIVNTVSSGDCVRIILNAGGNTKDNPTPAMPIVY